jgi:hypothetical protein
MSSNVAGVTAIPRPAIRYNVPWPCDDDAYVDRFSLTDAEHLELMRQYAEQSNEVRDHRLERLRLRCQTRLARLASDIGNRIASLHAIGMDLEPLKSHVPREFLHGSRSMSSERQDSVPANLTGNPHLNEAVLAGVSDTDPEPIQRDDFCEDIHESTSMSSETQNTGPADRTSSSYLDQVGLAELSGTDSGSLQRGHLDEYVYDTTFMGSDMLDIIPGERFSSPHLDAATLAEFSELLQRDDFYENVHGNSTGMSFRFASPASDPPPTEPGLARLSNTTSMSSLQHEVVPTSMVDLSHDSMYNQLLDMDMDEDTVYPGLVDNSYGKVSSHLRQIGVEKEIISTDPINSSYDQTSYRQWCDGMENAVMSTNLVDSPNEAVFGRSREMNFGDQESIQAHRQPLEEASL